MIMMNQGGPRPSPPDAVRPGTRPARSAQVTTWVYSSHPTLPLVRSKKYPRRPIGIDYTYAADGSLATRYWERPDGSNRLRLLSLTTCCPVTPTPWKQATLPMAVPAGSRC
jgi:hypothetical protein